MPKFMLYGVAILFGISILSMIVFFLFMNVALHSEGKMLFMRRYSIPAGSPVESVEVSTVRRTYPAPDYQANSYGAIRYLDSAGNILPADIPCDEREKHQSTLLLPQDTTTGRLFVADRVYAYADSTIGTLLHSFADTKISAVIGGGSLGDASVILLTQQRTSPFPSQYTNQVWHCRLDDYAMTLLQDESFRLGPMVLGKYELPELAATIVVTYQEMLSWGSAGDVYRPKHNNLYLFSEQYPKGVHLLRSSFKTGVVEHVQYDPASKSILVYGNATRPTASSEERDDPEIHRLSLKLASK